MILRLLENQIVEKIFGWKIIILYGARQVGKTTLVKKIFEDFDKKWVKTKYVNCDLFSNQEMLDYKNLSRIISNFEDFDLVVFDEAQNITNIWKILKILVEHFPKKQFIATWSSSFDLANKLNEPLTWRNYKFCLYPLSIEELKKQYDNFWINDNLERLIIYWSYPEMFLAKQNEVIEKLNLLAGDYLYRDIFKFEWIKKSSYVKSILQLLAFQIWNEVNYNEIWQKLWLNHITVAKYIDILEQAFIIFKLNSFSRNIRNEITKWVKIYFFDLGIRNSLIQGYNSLNLRQDIWALWENFLIIERLKYLKNNNLYRNTYFWRTYDQKEIDYIEEYDSKLFAYEFKFSKEKSKTPTIFLNTYKGSEFKLINKDNYLDFVIK